MTPLINLRITVMTKSSNLVPKRYQPRKWPVGKKPRPKVGAEFGAPHDDVDEIQMKFVSDIDEILIALRESLPPIISFPELPFTFTKGQRVVRAYRDRGIGPILFAFGDHHTILPSRMLDKGALDSAQAVFYRAKDRMAGLGTEEDVATNEALREAVTHYVVNTEKLKAPVPKPQPLDPEAVARRDAFLQAAAYHDAIVDSWTKESNRAEAAYKESNDPKDLKDWESASVTSANHYDFANDMRRMAVGVKPRNATMEFAEQTQMGTWSGRLKDLMAAQGKSGQAEDVLCEQ